MPMSPRLLRPRATGFNPRSISSLNYWLDASAASTLTLVSGAVSQWRSIVGSRTFSQSTANNRPTTTTVNGKTALRFDGSNDSLTSSGEAPANRTFFITALSESHTASGCVIFSSGSAGQFNNFGYSSARVPAWTFRGTGTGSVFTRSDGGSASSTIPLITTARYVLANIVDNTGNNILTRFNGVNVTGSGANLQGFTNGSVIVGATDNTGGSGLLENFYKGSVCEVLAYDALLSTTEITTVENYLRLKWGGVF